MPSLVKLQSVAEGAIQESLSPSFCCASSRCVTPGNRSANSSHEAIEGISLKTVCETFMDANDSRTAAPHLHWLPPRFSGNQQKESVQDPQIENGLIPAEAKPQIGDAMQQAQKQVARISKAQAAMQEAGGIERGD